MKKFIIILLLIFQGILPASSENSTIKELLDSINGIVIQNKDDSIKTAKQFLKIADYYFRLNNYAKSIEYATQGNSLDKSNTELYKLLALNAENSGQISDALKFYQSYYSLKQTSDSILKINTIEEINQKFQLTNKQLKIDNLENEKQLQAIELLTQEKVKTKQRIILYSAIFILIVFILFSVFYSRLFINIKSANKKLIISTDEIRQKNIEIANQRDDIERQTKISIRQKNEIEKIHDKLTESIEAALKIQESFLPQINLLSEQGLSFFLIYKPRNIISGDFYWIAKTPDKFYISVVDCTGHGVPGAFMSMLGISFLNDIVKTKNISAPDEILNYLRTEITEILHQKGTDDEMVNDGMDISLIAIDTQPHAQTSEGSKPSEVLSTYSAQWAGANNPLWIVRKSKSEKLIEVNIETLSTLDTLSTFELYELKGDKMPIGISYGQSVPFKNNNLDLFSDDIIYLFSDGACDQLGGKRETKFKTENLKKLLIENANKNLNEQKNIIETELENWMNYNINNPQPQTDDITVIGIKIS